jgi:hypothetical protein
MNQGFADFFAQGEWNQSGAGNAMNMPCITAEETRETDEKESRETRHVCPDISRGTACHIGCPDSHGRSRRKL